VSDEPQTGSPTATQQPDGVHRPETLTARVLAELKAVDLAVYRAVEGTDTPTLDVPLRRLTQSANHSKLWFAIAAALFAFGGRRGRRAAVTGSVAIGLNSLIVNQPLKRLGRRVRPDRAAGETAFVERHVDMPTSTSFPSGHSASGFAFAQAVCAWIPGAGFPLRALAAVVAYSRVHSGVHYPGDVLAGALIGMAVGEGTARGARRLVKSRAARSD
jgi:membrane-associated phospholipid phosphatase